MIVPGILVDLDQRDFVVAHKGEVAVQHDGIGNAPVTGHGAGANALHIPPAAAVLNAHEGGQGRARAAADALDGAAPFVQPARQQQIIRHGAQATVLNAQLFAAVKRTAHGAAVVKKGGAAGNQAQLFRQGVLALAGNGYARLAEQFLQNGFELCGAQASGSGKLRLGAGHVGACQNIKYHFFHGFFLIF